MGGAYCIIHAVFHPSEHTPARFGFIITRAVGNAVTRNLVRRRLKTLVDRRITGGLSGVDVVFRVLPQAAATPFIELEQQVNRTLDRVEALRSQVMEAQS